ncbi:hypothetical protein EKI60_06450 [Candidatus Saccharibacteria bacterium]|nr:MAG: hypothetical protein EKI60_06450 [Candidatus Saccharibacteria bacterium]
MANGTIKSANKTKYDAGGTGDNIIADGYIKTVEKVWVDTYALSATVITVGTMLLVATIPANKKITGVKVYFPAALSGAAATGTGTTISIGTKVGTTTAATTFLNAGECLTATQSLEANQGIPTVTTDVTDIMLTFNRLATTVTAGTITTVVRYT